MGEDEDLRRLAAGLSVESREDLLRASRSAIEALARIQEAVNEQLEHEHFLALSDAQEALALAYTRVGGKPLEGICAMCGRVLTRTEGSETTICGHCERSYGPVDE